VGAKPYFAKLPEYSPELARALNERVTWWYSGLPSTWWYQTIRKLYQLRYGLPSDASPFDVSAVGAGGEQGELSQVHANLVGNLVHHAVTMTVSDKPSWKPAAANGDFNSQAQTLIAASVLDFEMRDKQLDRVLRQVAELALLQMAGHFSVLWNHTGGGVYEKPLPMVDELGQPRVGPDGAPLLSPVVYNGKLDVRAHSPLDVIFNLAKRDSDHSWQILKRPVNRYDLIARNPKLEERIMALAPDHEAILDFRTSRGQEFESEEVPLYTLYHRPSDAVPKGREVQFLGDRETIIFDGPSVYGDRLPLYRVCPNEMHGTAFGVSPARDIISLNIVYNMLLSTAITNNAQHGVANVAVEKDAGLVTRQLEGGEQVWEVNAGRQLPTAINLVNTSPETYQLAGLVKGLAEQFMGLSATSMGQASADMSGAYAALLDSKALQFASLFQASYAAGVADMGTAIVRLYKSFAKTPRPLEIIVGDDQKYLLPAFTGSNIGEVDRVVVETKNALQDTVSGKMQLVQQLIEVGTLQGPMAGRALMELYRTGTLEPAVSGPEREAMLIKSENAAIAQGQVPPVRNDDDHRAHLAGHKPVGGTPQARTNARLMWALDEHQLGHVRALASAIPEVQALLVASGQEPLPPLPPPGGNILAPPGAPGAAPGGPPGPGGGGVPNLAGMPQAGGPQMPKGPQMPVLPTTGERYEPPVVTPMAQAGGSGAP